MPFLHHLYEIYLSESHTVLHFSTKQSWEPLWSSNSVWIASLSNFFMYSATNEFMPLYLKRHRTWSKAMVVVGSWSGGDIQIPGSVLAASCSHNISAGRRMECWCGPTGCCFLILLGVRMMCHLFSVHSYISLSRVTFKPWCLHKSPNLLNLVILDELMSCFSNAACIAFSIHCRRARQL